MKYRSKLEIIADILDVASDGAKKTRIMYIANLSYKLLEKYLKKTVGADLIRHNDNGYYEVTEKGRVFLERFNDFSSRNSKLERELEEISFEREVLESMCGLSTSKISDRRRKEK